MSICVYRHTQMVYPRWNKKRKLPHIAWDITWAVYFFLNFGLETISEHPG